MAVESRFVVIRHGEEVQTFMDKKAADEYDKMLDMADNLSEMLSSSNLTLDEKITEDLSIFLAQNREDVLIALQAKKPKVAKKVPLKAVASQAVETTQSAEIPEPATPTKKARATKKTKDELNEAS